MYTIWMCCGEMDQEATREEALGMAAAFMNGDGHSVLAVEGPNGEDLMAEAQELDRQRSQEWATRAKDSERRLLGWIEVLGPREGLTGREYVYSGQERIKQMAAFTALYGPDRVSWHDVGEGK